MLQLLITKISFRLQKTKNSNYECRLSCFSLWYVLVLEFPELDVSDAKRSIRQRERMLFQFVILWKKNSCKSAENLNKAMDHILILSSPRAKEECWIQTMEQSFWMHSAAMRQPITYICGNYRQALYCSQSMLIILICRRSCISFSTLITLSIVVLVSSCSVTTSINAST